MAWMRRWRVSRRGPLATALVGAGLVGYVVAVYAVVVLGGGVLIGHTSAPSTGLSILATAIVAIGFAPVRSALDRWTDRWLHHGRPAPYDVLSRFSSTVSGTSSADELPQQMAQVLAEGVGAAWAQVWLLVHGRLDLAATWPPRAETHGYAPSHDRHDVRTREVRRGDELLGILAVCERADNPLGSAEERLFAGLAHQSGLALEGAQLRAELAGQAAELAARAEELRLSRERLVDAHDAERRRLERDIHDGAQQHLVALAVNLRLAATLADRSPERAHQVLAEQIPAVSLAIDTLQDLSRGIYPQALNELGLGSALADVAAASPVPVVLTTHGLGRYASGVESTVYFCALEALQNATKHADPQLVRIDVSADEGHLTLTVEDDGHGFDDTGPGIGAGLVNMRDRVESAGGTLLMASTPGLGTWLQATVPVARVPAQRAT